MATKGQQRSTIAGLPPWWLKAGLIFNTIAFGAMGLPSVLAVLTGRQLLAVSPVPWGLWMAFGALVSFPWVVGISSIVAWLLFVRGARGLGAGLSCLPYANVGILALGLHWATTGG